MGTCISKHPQRKISPTETIKTGHEHHKKASLTFNPVTPHPHLHKEPDISVDPHAFSSDSLNSPSARVQFRLSYISRATRIIPSDEIEEIIKFSQKNNANLDVTGALVSCGDLFLQTLEGEKQVVMQLYHKIEKDKRHSNCVIIHTKLSEDPRGMPRQNTGWGMQNIYLKGNQNVLQKALNTMLTTVVESHYLLEVYTQKTVLQMLRDGIDPRTKPIEKVEKVILFSDICSYTTITESKPIEYIHRMLNEFYSIMGDNIASQSGEVSKLLGDGLMASFHKEDCIGAVKASIKAIKELKKARSQGTPEFENLEAGIGLASGFIVQGSFGSSKKKDFTQIGDVCNTASRLEGLTRQTSHSILFDEEVYNMIKDAFPNAIFVDEFSVKGKRELVKVYTIDDPELKIELPRFVANLEQNVEHNEG